ncbi:hypothetical protein CANTEDRAFT_113019 [Yamadazyma tenuis ATCC 10573]|uniref:Uncharacterized protein n=1 Tax=Candida tenuis (strain ATCC 10573 / BCRC 21748 / CBS 615 / JCM 9827 / NBRC 10315 / NRRL Y-1498 / VKM Y-70) TaxID=590646 RepID=G3B000_CANTC|nr:uncharacterized protein CANTEDRAFT_113019 [Yamadazyma tenuis ATCC 10573]EGV65279.1 hypothetical protein CANTEDRAFT_113019 [Yamadazyma tenuis ATCC 10573]
METQKGDRKFKPPQVNTNASNTDVLAPVSGGTSLKTSLSAGYNSSNATIWEHNSGQSSLKTMIALSCFLLFSFQIILFI